MVVSDITVKFKGYKCFKDEFAGFDKIMPINIIIGKNNSGKSSLIDLINFIVKNYSVSSSLKEDVQFKIEKTVSEEELKKVFSPHTEYSGTKIGTVKHAWDDHGKFLIGLKISCYMNNSFFIKELIWKDEEPFFKVPHGVYASDAIVEFRKERMKDYYYGSGNVIIPDQLKKKDISKIESERDITPEEDQKDKTVVSSNGAYCTNIIQKYVHDSDKDRELITVQLLNALNEIFNPDSIFKEITVRRHDDDKWEIYFYEEKKGLVPLSKSGSGLKTIIQVLLNLLVVPENHNAKASDYVFIFEELENNLHPSLLRRLFSYIEKFAIEKECTFFITTHSPVVIDKFSACNIAQMIHVTHDGKTARTKTIENFSDKSYLLDDIGAKASDLMQANGIVWLEGPSDRIYFNKWIELISNGEIKEHKDYECAFFGGSILSHFNADGDNLDKDFIDLLKINRNAVLITDSDKTSKKMQLKERVIKITKEMEEIGAFVWVTEVKEIENYIPAKVLETLFNKSSLPEIEKYQHFYYLPEDKKRKQNKLKNEGYWQKHSFTKTYDKVSLARNVVTTLSVELMEERYDWKEKMCRIKDLIIKWNEDR